MGLNVSNWNEFLAADGVSDVRETIEIGGWSMGPDGPVDPSIAVAIAFDFHGTPCGYDCMFYVGRFTSPEWDEDDAHTAMLNATRVGLVWTVSGQDWCLA